MRVAEPGRSTRARTPVADRSMRAIASSSRAVPDSEAITGARRPPDKNARSPTAPTRDTPPTAKAAEAFIFSPCQTKDRRPPRPRTTPAPHRLRRLARRESRSILPPLVARLGFAARPRGVAPPPTCHLWRSTASAMSRQAPTTRMSNISGLKTSSGQSGTLVRPACCCRSSWPGCCRCATPPCRIAPHPRSRARDRSTGTRSARRRRPPPLRPRQPRRRPRRRRPPPVARPRRRDRHGAGAGRSESDRVRCTTPDPGRYRVGRRSGVGC